MKISRIAKIVICTAALAGAVGIYFGNSALDREASSLGRVVEAADFCGFTLEPGSVDGIAGKHESKKWSLKRFRRIRDEARQAERDELARLKDAPSEAQRRHCEDVGQMAEELRLKLQ